jgi:hypothetical protein
MSRRPAIVTQTEIVGSSFIQSVPGPRTRGSVFQESASGIAGGFGFGSSLRSQPMVHGRRFRGGGCRRP